MAELPEGNPGTSQYLTCCRVRNQRLRCKALHIDNAVGNLAESSGRRVQLGDLTGKPGSAHARSSGDDSSLPPLAEAGEENLAEVTAVIDHALYLGPQPPAIAGMMGILPPT